MLAPDQDQRLALVLRHVDPPELGKLGSLLGEQDLRPAARAFRPGRAYEVELDAQEKADLAEALGLNNPQAPIAASVPASSRPLTIVSASAFKAAPVLPIPPSLGFGLCRGEVSLLTAAPGSAKSGLAVAAAVAIAHDAPKVLGLAKLDWTGPVMIVQAEDSADTFWRRYTAVVQHAGLPFHGSHDIHLVGGDGRSVALFGRAATHQSVHVLPSGEALLTHCKGFGLALIVLDTASACFAGIDENDAGDATACMGFCQRLASVSGAAVLVIAHTSKAAGTSVTSQDSQRGSRAWTASARTAIGISTVTEEEVRRRGFAAGFPGEFVSVEIVKSNHGRVGPLGWFRKTSAAIPALDPRLTPPDVTIPVLVVEPVTAPVPSSVLSKLDVKTLLGTLRGGVSGDPQSPFAWDKRASGQASIDRLLSTDFQVTDQDIPSVKAALREAGLIQIERRRYGDKGSSRESVIVADDAQMAFDDGGKLDLLLGAEASGG